MKKIILYIFLVSMFLLVSCFPTGKSSTLDNYKKMNEMDIPQNINQELAENLDVNANVSVCDDKNWYIYEAKLKKWDGEKIKKLFAKGKQLENKNEVEKNYIKQEVYSFNDKSILILSDGSIIFNEKVVPEKRYYNYINETKISNPGNLKENFPKDSLDNVDKDNAVKLVKEKVDNLGVKVSEDPVVYSMDSESLIALTDYSDEEDKKFHRWTKDDEAYAIVFDVLQDDKPVTKESYTTVMGEATGTRILGIVSKGGLISFELKNAYDVSKKDNVEDDICSVDYVINTIKEKYKDVMLTDPIEISEINLEYVPKIQNNKKGEYILSPVWGVEISQYLMGKDSEDKKKNSYKIFIDAVSGVEFDIGGAS